MIYRIDDDIVNFYCPKRFPLRNLDQTVLVAFNCDNSPKYVYNAMKDLKSFTYRTLEKLDIEVYMHQGETFISLCILAELRDTLYHHFKRSRVNE